MSDRHKARAGELGGAHVGRVVRARVGDETVVEDEIQGLVHDAGTTLVKFKHIEPSSTDALLGSYGGRSFRLDHDDEVEVIEP